MGQRLTLAHCLDRALEIIELADIRAMAADGPVTHVRDEMTDDEWRQLYLYIVEARRQLRQESDATSR